KEDAPLHIYDGVAHSVARRSDVDAAARIMLGKIRRPQQPRLVRHELQNFALVPTVIPAAEHFDAVAEQLLGDAWGDAEACGGVFAVGDQQIDFSCRNKIGQAFANNFATGRSDNVTNKKYAHSLKETKWSRPLGRGELGREPLIKVGTTSQPLGFPAPLAPRF